MPDDVAFPPLNAAAGEASAPLPRLILGEGRVAINAGRRVVSVSVTNTGDRPIQVGSHYHFFEANRALRFDRAAAIGMRLDIPAGTAVRFEPGDTRAVDLVALAGGQRVVGFSGLVDGSTSPTGAPARAGAAYHRAVARGFLDQRPLPPSDSGAAHDGEGGSTSRPGGGHA